VAALLFAAILCTRVQPGVTLAANHLVAVVFLGEDRHRGFDNSTAQPQHQMKCRFLLNVVIAQGATVLQLLAGEDQSLLVGGNTLLVLDLPFDDINPVGGLHLQGDRLSRQGLDKDLHTCKQRLLAFEKKNARF